MEIYVRVWKSHVPLYCNISQLSADFLKKVRLRGEQPKPKKAKAEDLGPVATASTEAPASGATMVPADDIPDPDGEHDLNTIEGCAAYILCTFDRTKRADSKLKLVAQFYMEELKAKHGRGPALYESQASFWAKAPCFVFPDHIHTIAVVRRNSLFFYPSFCPFALGAFWNRSARLLSHAFNQACLPCFKILLFISLRQSRRPFLGLGCAALNHISPNPTSASSRYALTAAPF